MIRLAPLARWLSAALLGLYSQLLVADRLQVAVASNFKPAMEVLAQAFEDATGHDLAVSYGSTGKHYAQILNGAPFELFLAADVEHPRRLEAEGMAFSGSRFTYAMGKLVLWSPQPGLGHDGQRLLEEGKFRFLAIANPKTAPYGRAAEQALRRLGLWDTLQPRIVRGENIGQAFAHVQSGNAELGFVAWSQLAGRAQQGSTWMVPQDHYEPIEQQAVLLKDSDAARAFLAFLRSEVAVAVIRAHGYSLP